MIWHMHFDIARRYEFYFYLFNSNSDKIVSKHLNIWKQEIASPFRDITVDEITMGRVNNFRYLWFLSRIRCSE